jgi:phospholipid/cholesterol/gamma-HCH transport system substrate-binding protein
MRLARRLAVAALAAAVLVVAWIALRGDGGTEYRLRLQNAGQLVPGNEVQVGGRAVGSVQEIRLTDDNLAEIDIRVDDEFAPLHEGTTALVRATSLSGVANRYVALAPGPNNARELEEGSVLGLDQTTSIVDLDQLFNTLDGRTRKGLQGVVRGFATWYAGKGEQANEGAKYLNPALSATRRLIGELIRDQGTLTAFLRNGRRTVGAIAARRDDLSGLVGNANATAEAIGSENVALARALGLLPGTLRKANTTFVNLRSTLDDLDVLVAESKPATKDLARFMRELRPVVEGARPTIGDFSRLLRRPGDANDLLDLLRRTPRLDRVSRPAFANTTTALRKSTPVIKFIRPYAPDFIGWLRDFGQASAAYDGNGHYARVQPMFNTFELREDGAGGQLVPRDPNQRLTGYQTGLRRCPGMASQAAADGSTPWRDDDGSLDCDPSIAPPGP